MRTTITLDDDVVRTVKNEMKSGSGKSFKDAVNDLIRFGRYFKQEQGSPAKRKRFKVQAFDMGVFDHLDYDNIGELLDEIEGPHHR